MMQRAFNVLFLCTGNSCRSVMAEVIMNRDFGTRFHAFSAGSRPRGAIDPETLEFLRMRHYETDALRSKPWDEFAAPGAPKLDFVFTVCDNAAGEVCPVWPGQPVSAHWGVPDPVAFRGTVAERAAFLADVYRMLATRIEAFAALPFDSLDRMTLKARLDDIGRRESETQ
ncbi:arsenate reductase ArsC [Marivibrio halodurans]|uniref:Arsenate reductase ArsC n=1 Tax=Marivibrio halodurans TaxID=2039722 RepID=A0A8J7SA61_9PROT|nr:arsenate reductase ArsC [Marivibrio halodurans]MBP5858277.1 arsenate reductase ArsC [Marivibrio halodurans]